jgi:hypothetical protein
MTPYREFKYHPRTELYGFAVSLLWLAVFAVVAYFVMR